MNKIIKADFHIHTTASDGRISPVNIVMQALAAGLTHIAITDHDTVDGLLTIANIALAEQITIIPGIEFSTDIPDCEVHILGYGLDIHDQDLHKQLMLLKDDRVDRVYRMAAKLAALGYPIDANKILQNAHDASAVGRPHVAKALVERGYFATVGDVFAALLNRDKPAYVPHYKLSPSQVINLIHQAGGMAVLAHPGLIGNDAVVEQIIALGIDGLEVFYPEHDETARQRYGALASQYGLVASGGSDFHAIPGRYPEKLGEFIVPESVAGELIQYVSNLRLNR